MSNIYIKEPSTNGKVLLHTSLGDIDIELWSKEAPLACRNFVQLCMEGYYNDVIFHRVVPGFIVQGGDPTGTGTGGESIYGKPFKDELHQRLRFVRRGLVAMANAGPNDNGSQFFFTLGPCNDLNKKHTIFGKVTGDTVYNMVRLGEVDVDENERPLNPPNIKWTKVLACPFEDIELRVDPDKEKRKKDEKSKAKSQSRATKDYKLLSFGDEAEFDEEESSELVFKGSKSSHDLAKDPKLSAAPAVTDSTNDNDRNKRSRENESSSSNSDSSTSGDNEKRDRRNRIKDKLTVKKAKIENTDEIEMVKSKENGNADKLKQMRDESRRLARELAGKSKQKAKSIIPLSDSEDEANNESSNPMFAEYKAQQKKYREKITETKKKGLTREQQTLEMLGNFRSKMMAIQEDGGSSNDESKTIDDEDDDNDTGWMLHKFKNSEHELRDAKDMNRDVNEDRYEITDPRNPLNQRRRENEKKVKDGGRDRKRDNRRESSGSERRHHRSDRHRHHRR